MGRNAKPDRRATTERGLAQNTAIWLALSEPRQGIRRHDGGAGMKKEEQATDKTKSRVRKVGLSTGYETDGTNYWLAPTHVDAWGEIQDEAIALDAIIAATLQTVAEVRRRVEARRRRWWDSVYRDLGLDQSVPYSFNRMEGRLSPAPVDKPNEKMAKEGQGD